MGLGTAVAVAGGVVAVGDTVGSVGAGVGVLDGSTVGVAVGVAAESAALVGITSGVGSTVGSTVAVAVGSPWAAESFSAPSDAQLVASRTSPTQISRNLRMAGTRLSRSIWSRRAQSFFYGSQSTRYLSSNWRAMTSFWISLVPSPMIISGASR